MDRYVADFETTTDINDVRVWAYCIVNIDTCLVESIGNNIEDFFEFISKRNSTVFFHNLKFDGEFILSHLLKNSYKHSEDKEEKTFDTLITDTGVFYQITIYFKKYKRRYLKCVIQDSLKKLPFKVSVIAKTFKLEESKLVIDYTAPRPKGHILTKEETDYIINDTVIVAKALKHQFDEGLEKMTIGSDALNGFKEIIGLKKFERLFPILPKDVDDDIRKAYKGGFTYLNPKFKDKRLEGLVFDVNSLYPSVMHDCPMPWGFPIPYEGEYKEDEYYPLYIQRLTCEFELMENHIPTIQLKKNRAFIETEYLTSSNGEIVPMTLTNVDLKLFLEHYKVYNLEFINGYKFKKIEKVFNPYIDYWSHIKENSEGGSRQLAKLMLNNLYGKFATNPLTRQKIPYLDNNVVKYELGKAEERDSVYTAVGAFITAWARDKTIRAAQSLYDVFIYADTDSLHINTRVVPPSLDVHPSRLGAWKMEKEFIDSKFLRAKTYMETDLNGKTEIKCAGMPENVKEQVTYDNFTEGASYGGKLQPKRYEGGIVLRETDFTIR